jgi:hypothetical protein
MAVPALTANSPSAGYIAWTAFTIQYGGVAYSVGASNTNATYTAWLYNGGSPLLAVSNNAPVMSSTVNGTAADWAGTTPVLGSDDLLLFVNRSGVPINVQAAQLIDGDMILSGTLTSANIATGGIVSNSLYTGAVQANLIQAGNIATDTITANQIAANAIGTTELSASAVIADKIAAGAITAEKLTIGSLGDNMVKNSGMEDASQANAALPANWTSAFESIGAPTFLWQAGIAGNKSIGITNSTANGGAWASDSFPVTAGQTLAVSLLAKASATTGSSVYVRIFYGTNQSMTRITTTPAIATNVQWLNTGTGVVTNATGVASVAYSQLVGGFIIPTTSTIQISGATVVPATATWAQVTVYNWTGTAASTVYFDEVNVNEVILSARIANGSITANNIQANTINTGQLNANAINGMTITSNTINSAIINSTTINSGTINGTNIYGNTFRSSTSASASQWLQIATTDSGQSPSIDWGGTTGSGDVHASISETYVTTTPTFTLNGTQHNGLSPRPSITMSGGQFISINGPATGTLTSTMQFNCNLDIVGSQNVFVGNWLYADTINANTGTVLAINQAQVNFNTATHGCSIVTQALQPGFGSAGQDNFLSCRAATNTLGSTNFANTVFGRFIATTGGYTTSSTLYSKADLEPMDSGWALDVIRQAPAYRFKSLHGDFHGLAERHPDFPEHPVLSNSEDWHFGPIYEDMHEHVRDSDGPTVNLGDLIGVLWGAVQELSEQVEAFQAK